jgi:hypothetical protein
MAAEIPTPVPALKQLAAGLAGARYLNVAAHDMIHPHHLRFPSSYVHLRRNDDEL